VSTGEVWALGEAYEPFMGRWSRLVAPRFLEWLRLPAGLRWVEVGCGTGALTANIVAKGQPASVVAVDASPGFVEHARRAVGDERVRFEVADARALPVPDGTCDAAVSALVLNFVEPPEAMVRELARVLGPQGTAAVYVWDYAGEMQLLRRFWDAAASLDESAAALDEGRRFPVCQPDQLEALWRGAALANVQVQPLDIDARFSSFDDFWRPFCGGQGPAPGYVASLDTSRRDALREGLRRQLPAAADGSISLVARAWAVRGTRA